MPGSAVISNYSKIPYQVKITLNYNISFFLLANFGYSQDDVRLMDYNEDEVQVMKICQTFIKIHNCIHKKNKI